MPRQPSPVTFDASGTRPDDEQQEILKDLNSQTLTTQSVQQASASESLASEDMTANDVKEIMQILVKHAEISSTTAAAELLNVGQTALDEGVFQQFAHEHLDALLAAQDHVCEFEAARKRKKRIRRKK